MKSVIFYKKYWTKGLIYLSAILVTVICIGGGLSWYLSYKLKPKITSGLTELIGSSTNYLYKLNFSNIHINFITGTASISDVVLEPDTNRYNVLVQQQSAPDNLYTIKLKKLQIRSFHPLKAYFDKVVHIRKLVFDKPTITMVNKFYSYNQDRPPLPRVSPYQFISKSISELKIEEVNFNNIDFKYVDNNGDEPVIDAVSNLSIRCVDYLIDATSATDPTRMYLFKEINISLHNYLYTTIDKFYNIRVEKLGFTTKNGVLSLKNFKLEPRYNEQLFGNVAGYARDRFEIAVNTIQLEGLSLPNYIKNQEIFAKSMLIEDGNINVFSDNRLKKLDRETKGRFPHQLLQKLPHFITIEQSNIKKVNVKYSEFDRSSYKKGIIDFVNLSGTLSNITNHPKVKSSNPVMQANLNSYLMGEGKLDVEFLFDLNDKNGKFNYSGNLGAVDGKVLNKITKPMGMVQIGRGNVEELRFQIEANDEIAKGDMRFKYNDLAVRIFKSDSEQNKLVKQGWASFLANNLVLESDNPSKGGALRVAPISYRRIENASFFSYIWRTIFSGIKYSVGITPEKEQELKARIEKFEEIKEDRDLRRFTREKRLEEKREKKLKRNNR